jgi:hypothetical protein
MTLNYLPHPSSDPHRSPLIERGPPPSKLKPLLGVYGLSLGAHTSDLSFPLMQTTSKPNIHNIAGRIPTWSCNLTRYQPSRLQEYLAGAVPAKMIRTSASGLPTIKCSSCAVEIDIMQLADHVCTPAAASSECIQNDQKDSDSSTTATTAAPRSASATAPKLDRATTFNGASFSKRSENHGSSGRMRPPRIDSNAASKTT